MVFIINKKLNVYFVSVEDIRFVRGLEDIKVTSAKVTVTFECELSKDGLKVEWYKGDKKLRRSDRYNMSSVGKVYKLTIDNVDSEDVGAYSVEFEKLSSSAKLALEGKLSNYMQRYICIVIRSLIHNK